MELVILVLASFGALACGVVGAYIAGNKCASTSGFLWGLILGPIGVVVACFLDERPRCPRCKERVNPQAEICAHCRSAVAWVAGEPVAPETVVMRELGLTADREHREEAAQADQRRAEDRHRFYDKCRRSLTRAERAVEAVAMVVVWVATIGPRAVYAVLARLLGEQNRLAILFFVILIFGGTLAGCLALLYWASG